MKNSYTLKGRVALVTGAASGIGYAIAQEMVRAGAQLILTDFNEKDGKAVALEMGGDFIACDLSSRQACSALLSTVLQSYGSVDILVNNAGFQHTSSLEDFPEEVWEKMLSVLLTAPFQLTRGLWKGMKSKGWGRIVNISSIHGLVASPSKAAYVSAKHGLIGLTKATALEGGEHGITANAICPGWVRTPLVEKQIMAQAEKLGVSREQALNDSILGGAAVKRLIEPSEIADLALYLCSDSARSITGSAYSIDGGWVAR